MHVIPGCCRRPAKICCSGDAARGRILSSEARYSETSCHCRQKAPAARAQALLAHLKWHALVQTAPAASAAETRRAICSSRPKRSCSHNPSAASVAHERLKRVCACARAKPVTPSAAISAALPLRCHHCAAALPPLCRHAAAATAREFNSGPVRRCQVLHSSRRSRRRRGGVHPCQGSSYFGGKGGPAQAARGRLSQQDHWVGSHRRNVSVHNDSHFLGSQCAMYHADKQHATGLKLGCRIKPSAVVVICNGCAAAALTATRCGS